MVFGIIKAYKLMAKPHKSKRRKKISPTLAALFKMTREELQTRKATGAGIHRPKTPASLPRGEQKRRAVEEQSD
jgi:hypothetical protein